MHEVEAATITSDKLAGQEDVSKCLPGWIRTMCDAFQKGEGYTLSHSAVSALAHTLICARVRAERLVRERDAEKAEIKRLRELLTRVAETAYSHSEFPDKPDGYWAIRQMAYEIPVG
jgi:hypothetical protein